MTECPVHQAAEAFIGRRRESGNKKQTLYTYRKDFDVPHRLVGIAPGVCLLSRQGWGGASAMPERKSTGRLYGFQN